MYLDEKAKLEALEKRVQDKKLEIGYIQQYQVEDVKRHLNVLKQLIAHDITAHVGEIGKQYSKLISDTEGISTSNRVFLF